MTKPVKEKGFGADEEGFSEDMLIRMTPEGFDAFLAAIEAPAALVPELVELFKRRRPGRPFQTEPPSQSPPSDVPTPIAPLSTFHHTPIERD
jgi:hypothetical protein